MISTEVIILNEAGLHARPAQQFVTAAGRFESEIKIIKEDGIGADAKSILGIMTLALGKGTKVTIQAEGSDEQAAVEELAQLIESKFGEE